MAHHSVLDAPQPGQITERPRPPAHPPKRVIEVRRSPRVDPEEPERPRPVERRDSASRQKLVRRIEMEWEEMPGLRLTVAQARRLFGLPEDICVRVLDTLVGAGILFRYGNGAYGCRRIEP